MSRFETIKWDVRKFGLGHTVGRLVRSIAYHTWLHLSPKGRRELEFDELNDVDTEEIIEKRNLPLNSDSEGYFPSKPKRFVSLINRLPISRSQFTFIDVGCGKGRPLIIAHSMGFDTVLGIELSPLLASIAVKNTSELDGVKIIKCDAAEFAFPPGNLVIYMFNPFSNPTMGQFICNLESSLIKKPRKVYLIYVSPFCEEAISNSRQLRKMCGIKNHYSIYESEFA